MSAIPTQQFCTFDLSCDYNYTSRENDGLYCYFTSVNEIEGGYVFAPVCLNSVKCIPLPEL